MKVLFAVNNDAVSDAIEKKYQQMYKEIIVSKNVYYFNAILKELQKDKSYDRVVISEDLEPFANNNYDMIDNFIFERLDNISDEATSTAGEDIPIILIATDRRTKSDNLLIKLFGIGIYSALLGQDRSIEEVCKLINKPRAKKEAKVYYKIDSNDVEYKPENEDDVSEQEIENIIAHYKRLGKNEDRFVDSFNNIASQYTDEQLKVIIKFLPLNVKAVLEANSPKYQQLTSYRGAGSRKTIQNKTKLKNNTDKVVSSSGIKIESIGTNDKKLNKPVIIPKMKKTEKTAKNTVPKEEIKPTDIKKTEKKIEEEIIEEPKRGRGTPKKVQDVKDEEVIIEESKRGRGRPKKVQEIPTIEDEEETILPGFEQIDSFDDLTEDENDNFENFENNEEDTILPGFDDSQDYEDSYENDENYEKFNSIQDEDYEDIEDNDFEKNIESYKSVSTGNLQSLLSSDKKIVAFLGTSKNGTSFLVNNLADLLSKQGIKTAVLDLTKNRNAYYIYTKNEESLRKIAYSCTTNLANGVAEGIKVNNNLDVYTSLPGENNEIDEYETILETLVKNYSLVLLDCDFNVNYGYLKEAQEIYLVQSMDVLTIQPLTAYLRDLKAKQVLEPSKLRVVINKYTKVRGVTEKVIIGGMAFYNAPAMSFMTELFNRETVKSCSIPFDEQVYSKYLEGLINCNISVNAYQKDFIGALRKLGNMVYPLIGSNNYKDKYYSKNVKNPYEYGNNTFDNQMNATLDKMKKNY